MRRPAFRRYGLAPGTLSAQDQAVVDQFRATLTAPAQPAALGPRPLAGHRRQGRPVHRMR